MVSREGGSLMLQCFYGFKKKAPFSWFQLYLIWHFLAFTLNFAWTLTVHDRCITTICNVQKHNVERVEFRMSESISSLKFGVAVIHCHLLTLHDCIQNRSSRFLSNTMMYKTNLVYVNLTLDMHIILFSIHVLTQQI